jgi:hypothetical protein
MLRPLLLSALFLLPTAPAALADACDTLISSAEGALADPSITPAEKSVIESLLQAGRDAKASGNVQACQNALQSPRPFRDPSKGRDCNETPDTV